MTFYDRLKRERIKRNLTQKEMGLMLGVLQSHYSNIERGLQGLNLDKLALLHLKLGIDLNYIITGKYTKLDYGLDKMPFSELKKLNGEIFRELETRVNEYETSTENIK